MRRGSRCLDEFPLPVMLLECGRCGRAGRDRLEYIVRLGRLADQGSRRSATYKVFSARAAEGYSVHPLKQVVDRQAFGICGRPPKQSCAA
jgi:hypothetical protein